MTCAVCGQEHTSVFCPPRKQKRNLVPRSTCEHPLPWERIGRCTYCSACMTRLYQGTPPKDEKGRDALLAFFRKITEQAIQIDGSADGAP